MSAENSSENDENHSIISKALEGTTGNYYNVPQPELNNIEELPNELLFPIVQSLSYKDYSNVLQVSTRWHSIVDELLGRKLFVGKPCQFTPDDEERYKHHYVPIESMLKVGVNTCYIGEVVDPTAALTGFSYYMTKIKETLIGQNLPKFKHPHLVRNLFFDGPLPSRYFETMVKSLVNLERLDIHLSALSCLTEGNVRFHSLRRLETLNVWGHKLTQGLFTQYYSSSSIVNNLVVLLESNYFPNLHNLGMEYAFDLREQSGRVTDALLDFLQKHKETLHKLKVSVNLFVTEAPTEVDTLEDREWFQKSRNTSKLLKLRHMELTVTSIYRVRMTKIWTTFIENQTNLETAQVITFRLDQGVMNRITEQNYETLVSISVTRLILNDNGRFAPVDCTVFEKCMNLKTLFLEGMPSGTILEYGIINISKIPRTLEKIELGTLPMSIQDSRELLTQFPVLKFAFLADIGRIGDLGVTVGTIEEVIRTRRISSLTLYGSVNGRFPEEGLSNGNPENEGRIHLRFYGMLEMKLNDEGYYVTVAREQLQVNELTMDDADD